MLLYWPLVIPFFTAVLCLLAWRSTEMQRGISLLGALGLLAAAVRIFAEVSANGPVAAQAGGWPAPFGITLVADLLSAVMLLLVGIVAVAALAFAIADVNREEEHHGHHPLTHTLLAGLSGAFLTGDLFSMYVWFEVILISSFGLLVIGGGKAQLDGAVKYVGLNLIATVAFLSGVGLLYGATGALNMADLHDKLAGRTTEAPVIAAAALLVFAFGSKAALFPAFFWLPASYHTPSFSSSAVFSALLTKVGVYALFRVFTLCFEIDGTPIQTVLAWGAGLTMFAGVLGALSQRTLRRVLGFSIIGSVGFMILGLAVATPLALAGAAFYMFQDILVKANLFLGAGAVRRLGGSEDFARIGGLWRARPWFSVLCLLPLLSLAGIPPLAGFWAKLLLVQATLAASWYWLTLAVLGAGLLTVLVVGRLWAETFWKAHPDGDGAVSGTLPATMLVPLVVLALLIVWIGIGAGPFVAGALAIGEGLADPAAYIAAVRGEAAP
jgi:multicomponent Na+:H+ antiporter subunit D